MFYDFVQDFTPHFNYDIIIKGDSVFMEDQVVNSVYPQYEHYHLILVRIQSFQLSESLTECYRTKSSVSVKL